MAASVLYVCDATSGAERRGQKFLVAGEKHSARDAFSARSEFSRETERRTKAESLVRPASVGRLGVGERKYIVADFFSRGGDDLILGISLGVRASPSIWDRCMWRESGMCNFGAVVTAELEFL